MMGIMVPETCWASNKICNKKSSVASSWHFISTYVYLFFTSRRWSSVCTLCHWVAFPTFRNKLLSISSGSMGVRGGKCSSGTREGRKKPALVSTRRQYFIRDVDKTAFCHTIKNPKMRVVLSTDLGKVKYGFPEDSIEAYGGMEM